MDPGVATDVEPDPLYDAPYLVFVYAAWVGSAWIFGQFAGLAVLIAGTAILTVAGSRVRTPVARSFAADMSVILLFCAAASGSAVFVIAALQREALLTLWLVATVVTIVAFLSSAEPRSQ